MSKFTYILSLGGNIGNVDANFRMALSEINAMGSKVIRTSDIFLSEAWGFASSDLFRNMIAEVVSDLEPFDMLTTLQKIERDLGRTHKTIDGYYESRSIDIDIIFCNDEVIETPRLSIPHPLMHKRNFVLVPLMDHWSEWQHPVLGISVAQLKEKSSDTNKVWRVEDSMIYDL